MADNFFVTQNAQTGLTAHPASCSLGVGFCIPKLKMGCKANQRFHLVSKLRIGGSLPPLSILVHGAHTVNLDLPCLRTVYLRKFPIFQVTQGRIMALVNNEFSRCGKKRSGTCVEKRTNIKERSVRVSRVRDAI